MRASVVMLAKRARLSALQARAAQTARSKPAVAITGLEVHTVREPVSRREYVLVMLSTDAGITGIGEAAARPDAATAIAALLDVKDALRGRDATAVESIRLLLARRPAPTPSVVQAAINMALLDITGKLARAPVCEILGGPTRFKARAATSLDASDLSGSLQRTKADGFRAALMPLVPPEFRNSGQAFVRSVRDRLEKLRQEAGDGMDFVLDCGGALTPGDAQMLAHALETFHLLWLEEPCPPLNLNAVARLAGESVTPVGFGRGIQVNSRFQDLLRHDAIDLLRPDIATHGITQIRKAAALAETYYTAVAPFHRGGPVATAACLQLAASIPNFFAQEVPFPAAEADRRMRAELITTPLESVREGYFALPKGPGLGVTLNTDALSKYRAA